MKDRETSERLELELLPKALRLVPAGRRFLAIDGGANIGRWSIELAKHFAAVLSFEPVEDTWRNLREHVERLHNVYPQRLALLDRRCVVAMRHPLKRTSSTSYFAEQLPADSNRPDRVLAIPIDSLTFEDCDLIKLDLEGAELRALNGARATLERLHPLVIVECIDKQLRRYGDSTCELHAFLLDLGYRLELTQAPNRVYVG